MVIKNFLYRCLAGLFKRYSFSWLTGIGAFVRFRERVFVSDVQQAPGVRDFQKENACRIIRTMFECYRDPRKIVALDVGCSAGMTSYLAGYVKKIVGISLHPWHLQSDSCPANAVLLTMDAARITFPDKTFDFVFSADTYEHIADLPRAIDEQLRVLKDGGYGYATWGPLWSSHRGHHIGEVQVNKWEKSYIRDSVNYRNNGECIRDWSHLLLSPDEMYADLLPKLRDPDLTRFVVDYIYTGDDLNRFFVEDYRQLFSQKNMRILLWETDHTDPPEQVQRILRNKYGREDFSTKTCRMLFARA